MRRYEETYPDVKVQVLVRHRLDIEAYCWYRGDDFADLGIGQRVSLQCHA